MKIKFNQFERVAGLFVLIAIGGALFLTLSLAVKKGWFESKLAFKTKVESADGLHPGTSIQIAGLRAGSVEEIELLAVNEIIVHFKVFERFRQKIRQDSFVQVVRPFIIGEKVLEISIGSEDEEILKEGSMVELKPSFDVMEVLNGRKMGPFLGSIEQLTQNLKTLVEAFGDPERTKALVRMFDRLDPLIDNLNSMSKEFTKLGQAANKHDRVDKLLPLLISLSRELDLILPSLNKEAPDLGLQLAQVIQNLATLTDAFEKITPAINAVAPDLPRTGLRAVEALDEAVVLLKAMQQSWFLRSKVENVKEEEARRSPTSETTDK